MTNALLAWLDHHQAPPTRLSIKEWTVATATLVHQARHVRRVFKTPQATWEDFENFERTIDHLRSLAAWCDFVGDRTTRLSQAAVRRTEKRHDRAVQQLLASSATQAMLPKWRGWLARKTNKLSPLQRRRVLMMIDKIKDAAAPQTITNKLVKLEKDHEQRAVVYEKTTKKKAVMLTAKQAKQLPAQLRRSAKRYAQDLGKAGWALNGATDLGEEALKYLQDESVRKKLWMMKQSHLENDRTVANMLKERHQQALAAHHPNYANYVFQGKVIPKASAVNTILRQGLVHHQKIHAHLDQKLQLVAEQQTIEPWNMEWLLHQQAYQHEPEKAFPQDATLSQCVPELLAAGGWTVEHVTRPDEQYWCWDIRNNANKRAQIWLAPQGPDHLATSNNRGQMQMVRTHWNGGRPAMAVAAISMLRHPSPYLSFEDLTTLAHELGHVLHFLSHPGNSPQEDNDITDDVVEFPSQVLEHAIQDPALLARWSSPKAPLARRTATWRKFLTNQPQEVLRLSRMLMCSLVDLKAHQQSADHQTLSFDKLLRTTAAAHNMPISEQENPHYRYFIWSDYASNDYAYPLGLAMAEHALVRRPDGTVNSVKSFARFNKICDNILAPGLTPRLFRKAWQAWKKEPLVQSASRGMLKHITAKKKLG